MLAWDFKQWAIEKDIIDGLFGREIVKRYFRILSPANTHFDRQLFYDKHRIPFWEFTGNAICHCLLRFAEFNSLFSNQLKIIYEISVARYGSLMILILVQYTKFDYSPSHVRLHGISNNTRWRNWEGNRGWITWRWNGRETFTFLTCYFSFCLAVTLW